MTRTLGDTLDGGPVSPVPESNGENLNRALHTLLAEDPRTYLLGEDVADPYGGAFKITRGLSRRFPRQVHTTPISEAAIVGAGAGLALAGGTAFVEMMFGDFTTLAFDQIVNFAAKSVSMYGTTLPMRLVVRCPVGGGRGYGPTHSQSLQKHFIGWPGLGLFEMSPFHDNTALLRSVLATDRPAMFFEHKTLYGSGVRHAERVDDLFRLSLLGPDPPAAHVRPADLPPDCVLIAPGGVAERALVAARSLLLHNDTVVHLIVPARLYPFDVTALRPVPRRVPVFVVEESTPGGTWGAEVANVLHENAWPQLPAPVRVISSADRVVPAAPHLERATLVQAESIHRAIAAALAST
jgi:pyruvate dehydrogenase E1 component beta subunit